MNLCASVNNHEDMNDFADCRYAMQLFEHYRISALSNI